MGCHVMEPEIFSMIPKNKAYGMNDVIRKAINSKKFVSSFITKKGFIDIGNTESYKKAKEEHVKKIRRSENRNE